MKDALFDIGQLKLFLGHKVEQSDFEQYKTEVDGKFATKRDLHKVELVFNSYASLEKLKKTNEALAQLQKHVEKDFFTKPAVQAQFVKAKEAVAEVYATKKDVQLRTDELAD